MPCCVSVAARAFPENHGKRREYGVERTSAMVSTPASRSRAKKRSAAIFEWPMLNRSKDIAGSLAENLRQFYGRPSRSRPAFLQGPAALQCYRTADKDYAGGLQCAGCFARLPWSYGFWLAGFA